ncbi:MAG: ABC transporter permease [Clostridiaceae bacterium]
MENFLYLRILDKFSKVFTKLGVDYKCLRSILQLKLTLDKRRVPTLLQNNKKSDDKDKKSQSLLIYIFYGVFIGMIMLPSYSIFIKMSMVLGLIMFMIMMSLISDFSSVLLDTKDRKILYPRPISPKTINVARVLHIGYYLTTLALSISLVSLIISLIKYGVLFFIVFLLQLIVMILFILFFTSILYYLILNAFDGEKLKDIINYFQIVFSIFMFILYQIMGRMFAFVDKIVFVPKWWMSFIPSCWFASPYVLIFEHNYSYLITALTVTSIILPIILFIIYIKYISRKFEEKLYKIDSCGKVKIKRKSNFGEMICNILCKNKEEKAFYKFTCDVIANERKLKLTVYPNIAMGVIIPFIMFFNTMGIRGSFKDGYAKLSNGRGYLWAYLSAGIFSIIIIYIGRSEKYKGSWIYTVLPINNKKNIYRGSFKAFVVKLINPAFEILSLVIFIIFGIKAIPHLIIIYIFLLILILIIYRMEKNKLPFSVDYSIESGEYLAQSFLTLILSGAMAGIHYFFGKTVLGYCIICLSVLVIFIILWKQTFRGRLSNSNTKILLLK